MKFEAGSLIGDPHLGRKFEVGVPSHRRGEREAEVVALFVEELASPGPLVVAVGDLFDNPYVPHLVVKQAIDATLDAALARPEVTFVVMAGNHDVPRKLTATGAFSVYARATRHRLPNLHVLTEPAIIESVAFFPWQWEVPAVDQVPKEKIDGVIAIVGHWDLASFGGNDSHLAPVAALRHAFGEVPIYSGHYHVPGLYTVDGTTVTCTGSIQPFTQSEDPEGLIYVTLDLEGAHASADCLHDKCVRVRLRPGEELPTGIEARSIIGQRVLGNPGLEEGQAITLDKFDWNSIITKALAPLVPEVRAFIQDRLPAHAPA